MCDMTRRQENCWKSREPGNTKHAGGQGVVVGLGDQLARKMAVCCRVPQTFLLRFWKYGNVSRLCLFGTTKCGPIRLARHDGGESTLAELNDLFATAIRDDEATQFVLFAERFLAKIGGPLAEGYGD
jgi:hypothetical protein